MIHAVYLTSFNFIACSKYEDQGKQREMLQKEDSGETALEFLKDIPLVIVTPTLQWSLIIRETVDVTLNPYINK